VLDARVGGILVRQRFWMRISKKQAFEGQTCSKTLQCGLENDDAIGQDVCKK
jgi:hypothetical protein